MQVEIVAVSFEDKGKYKVADVIYKGSDGKVANKKVMSFGASKDVFSKLKEAEKGKSYAVTAIKNDNGYWDWTEIIPSSGAEGTKVASAGSPKSTYETAEERALRQVFIVKQSSLSNAIELIKLNHPKGGVTPETVIELADRFHDYVFGRNSDPMADLESDVV